VKPITAQLEQWLTEAASLRVKVEAGKNAGHAQRRVSEIRGEASRDLEVFDRRVESAGKEIAQHGLVRDTRRALLGLIESFGVLGHAIPRPKK